MTPRRPLTILGTVALTAFAVSSSGCHRGEAAPATASQSAADTPAVRTARPERHSVRKTVEISGHVEGFEQTAIFSKTSGYVKDLRVDIDARVTKGQVLAELSIPELEDELRLKEASVEQAAAEVELSRQSLRVAEASAARYEANERLAAAGRTRTEANYTRAKADYDRVRRLTSSNAVSTQEVDQSTDQYRSAEAARAESVANVEAATAYAAEARAQRDRAAADVKVAAAKRAATEADRNRQATLVGYGQIRAPFDGVITRRNVHVGHLLQPTGAQATNGVALFEIARIDPVRVSIDVPELDAPLVRTGTPAAVRVPALRDREFPGKVARTGWALDAPTRTLRVEIDVPNPAGELRPGMYALGRVDADLPDALTVPAAAVFLKDDQNYVVRVEDGRAKLTPVKLGRRQGNAVELVKKEVRPPSADGRHAWEPVTGDEVIVAEAPTTYADGQPVSGATAAPPDTRLARRNGP